MPYPENSRSTYVSFEKEMKAGSEHANCSNIPETNEDTHVFAQHKEDLPMDTKEDLQEVAETSNKPLIEQEFLIDIEIGIKTLKQKLLVDQKCGICGHHFSIILHSKTKYCPGGCHFEECNCGLCGHSIPHDKTVADNDDVHVCAQHARSKHVPSQLTQNIDDEMSQLTTQQNTRTSEDYALRVHTH